MYPPVATPTSPDDHNMVILDGLTDIPASEQIPLLQRNPLLDNGGSTTARQELKRASLRLEYTTTKVLDDNDVSLRSKRYSLNDHDLIMAMSKRKSNTITTSTTVAAGTDDLLDNRPTSTAAVMPTSVEEDENANYCDGEEIDNKNGNARIMDCGQQLVRVVATSNNDNHNPLVDGQEEDVSLDRDGTKKQRHSAATCEESESPAHSYKPLSSNDDGETADSASDSKDCVGGASSGCEESLGMKNRSSLASSSDESVELREKGDQDDELQDEFDEQRQLLFGQPHQQPLNMDILLSPNEGPLARRYAEVSQFNNGKR